MHEINIKAGMPSTLEAVSLLRRELDGAKQRGLKFLRVVHGYGSTGKGGDIRIAAQKQLRQMADNGEIAQCIFGENWSRSDSTTWSLLRTYPELKNDPHLGRKNFGITVVLL